MATWDELEQRWPGISAAWDAAYGDVELLRLAVVRVRGPRQSEDHYRATYHEIKGTGIDQAMALVTPCDFRRYDAEASVWLSSSWTISEKSLLEELEDEWLPGNVHRCFGPGWGADGNTKEILKLYAKKYRERLPFEVDPETGESDGFSW